MIWPISSVSHGAALIADVSQQLNCCLYAVIQARLPFFPQRPLDPSDRKSAGGNPVIKHCASIKLMPPSSPWGLFLFRLNQALPELEEAEGWTEQPCRDVQSLGSKINHVLLQMNVFGDRSRASPWGNYQSTTGLALYVNKSCSQDKSKKNYARLINSRVPV